jgi:integrase/recombinase XerD
MASVHSQPGTPYWCAFFRGADGKRKKKTLGLRVDLASRKQALQAARELERAVQRALQGQLTEARAREVVSEIFQIAAGRPLVFHSTESWMRDWLADKTAAKAKATSESYRCTVDGFIAHLGDRARLGIEQVTPRDVQTFRDAQVKAGKSPQTANFYVKQLRIPFGLARKLGLIPSNPAEAVEALPAVRAERQTFTIEQVRAVLNAAEEAGEREWYGAILVGFYTGQRLRDVTNLRWSNIDLATGVLRLTQQKTKRSVTQPLHPELQDWLLTLSAPDNDREPLFPKLTGRRTGGRYGLSGRFVALMEAAGIVSPLARDGSEGKGRKLSALSFHSLRHTFTSNLANGGVAAEIRQKLTGHSSEDTHRLYTHHEMAPLRRAVGKLPTLKRPQKARK